MGIARLKPDEVDSLIEAVITDGVVIVEDLLDPGLLGRFNAELDPLLQHAALGDRRSFINDAVAHFFGPRTRHVTGIAGKSRVFAEELIVHPTYLSACDAVLGPNCADYVVNLAQVLDRGPGSEQQILHRDEDVWVHLRRPHGHIQLSSVVALVDFTAENGATVVAPGSHLWEPGRAPVPRELVPAEMAAGSAVIYVGATMHAGGENRTADVWRRGMHLSYCVGWLRTEENQCLTTPLDVVRSLPRRNQELLGFGAHDAIGDGGGYLGTVELQDPAELIRAGLL